MAKDTFDDRLERQDDPRVSRAPHSTEAAGKGKERANALSIVDTNTQVVYSPPNLPHSKELAPLRARRRFMSKPNGTPLVQDEARPSIDKSGIWNISKPSHCLSLRLPDEGGVRVTGLMYSNSGSEILALRGDGIHHIWQWPKQKDGSFSKATAGVLPNLYKPKGNLSMKNDMKGRDPCSSIASIALTKNDDYVLSTSGGAVSLFNKENFQSITSLVPPPPTATCIAFDPEDSYIAAVGMDDCSILIFDFGVMKFAAKILGHHERITGLAFSDTLKVLISSALDGEIIVWGRDGWVKKTSKHFLQIIGDIRLHLHKDQKQLLVIHSDHLLVLEVSGLDCMTQWRPLTNGSITNAAYSCDGQQIYVTLDGGTIVILTASSLTTRCRISISAYMALCSSPPYPVMVCAHPSEPNQFAFGLSDGRVFVIEPTESAGIWFESVSAPSTSGTEYKEQAADLPSQVIHRLDKKSLPDLSEVIDRLDRKRRMQRLENNVQSFERLRQVRRNLDQAKSSLEALIKREEMKRDVVYNEVLLQRIQMKFKEQLEQERPSISIEKIEVQQNGEANPSVKLEEKRPREFSEMTEVVEQAIVQLPSGELDGKRLHRLSMMMNVQQEVGPSLSMELLDKKLELLEKKLFGTSEMIEVDQDGSGESEEKRLRESRDLEEKRLREFSEMTEVVEQAIVQHPSGELDGKRLHKLSMMMNVQQEVGPSLSMELLEKKLELLEKKLFGSSEMIDVDQDGSGELEEKRLRESRDLMLHRLDKKCGDQKKLQGQLITEQEAMFVSKPSPMKQSGKKVGWMSCGGASNRRLSLGGAMLTPRTNLHSTRASPNTLHVKKNERQSNNRDDRIGALSAGRRGLDIAGLPANRKHSLSEVKPSQHIFRTPFSPISSTESSKSNITLLEDLNRKHEMLQKTFQTTNTPITTSKTAISATQDENQTPKTNMIPMIP